MEMQQKQRFWNTVTNLYMFLSIMIVLYHNNGYSFYESGGNVSWITKRVIDIVHNGFLADLPVAMFIFISGFLLYRDLTFDNMKSKMKARILSLAVPYVLWNAVIGFALFLLQTIPFTRNRMQVRELESFDFISILKGLTISPYDGVLWTMLQLMIFTVLAPVIYLMLRNCFCAMILLMSTFILSFSGIPLFITIHGNVHLFTYLAGAYIGMTYFERIWRQTFYKRVSIICAGVIFVLCVLYEYGITSILLKFAGIAALYIISFGIAQYTKNSSKLCYGLSIWIYAIHNLLQPCLSKVWLMTGVQGDAGALLNTFFIAALTVVICITAAKLCKKITPGIYNVLSGGRG